MFLKILRLIQNKYFQKILEHSSVKVVNKIAKPDIKLNLIIFNFYLFLKAKIEVNLILFKNYLKLKY